MPAIDLAFVLTGRTVPLDHGYDLFAAISRVVPAIHGDRGVGVHAIRGIRSGPGVMHLTDGSRLRLRLPSESIAPYLALAGKALDLTGHRIRVGIPQVESHRPLAALGSRLVTIKNASDPEKLLAAVNRELTALDIRGEASIVPIRQGDRIGQPLRRIVRVKGRKIVGYALRVEGLSDADSHRLQEAGIGGRRHFGCGLFTPFGEGGSR